MKESDIPFFRTLIAHAVMSHPSNALEIDFSFVRYPDGGRLSDEFSYLDVILFLLVCQGRVRPHRDYVGSWDTTYLPLLSVLPEEMMYAD